MPTTPTYSLPYPLPTDPADVPADMAELANAVDAKLVTFDGVDDSNTAAIAALDTRVDSLETQPVAKPPLVTSLPGSPANADEVYLLASDTLGVVWHLRYRAASASAHKWEFVGGPPLHAEVLTAQVTNASAPVDLATVGPSVTVPRAGEYEIYMAAQMFGGTGPGSPQSGIQIVVAGMTAGANVPAENVFNGVSDTRVVALTASQLLKVQYYTTAYNTYFRDRRLQVRPVRLS